MEKIDAYRCDTCGHQSFSMSEIEQCEGLGREETFQAGEVVEVVNGKKHLSAWSRATIHSMEIQKGSHVVLYHLKIHGHPNPDNISVVGSQNVRKINPA